LALGGTRPPPGGLEAAEPAVRVPRQAIFTAAVLRLLLFGCVIYRILVMLQRCVAGVP